MLDSCQCPKLPSRCRLVSHSPWLHHIVPGAPKPPSPDTFEVSPLNPITASSSSSTASATSSLGKVWVSIIWRLGSLSSQPTEVRRLLVVMVTDLRMRARSTVALKAGLRSPSPFALVKIKRGVFCLFVCLFFNFLVFLWKFKGHEMHRLIPSSSM